MAQRLRIRTKKDGSARGVAIRKTNATKASNIASLLNNDDESENVKTPSLLSSLFSMAYQKHLQKYGESTSKAT